MTIHSHPFVAPLCSTTLPDIYSNKTFFNIFSDGLQRHEAQVLAGWEKNHNPTKKTLMGIYAWGFKVLASNLDWF